MGNTRWFVYIVAMVVAFVAFIIILLLIGSPLLNGDMAHSSAMSIIVWIVTSMGAIFLGAIVLAMVISAITWGQWLGDFKLNDRDEECKPNVSEAALEILDQRYARGEITREEYSRVKEELRVGRRRRR